MTPRNDGTEDMLPTARDKPAPGRRRPGTRPWPRATGHADHWPTSRRIKSRSLSCRLLRSTLVDARSDVALQPPAPPYRNGVPYPFAQDRPGPQFTTDNTRIPPPVPFSCTTPVRDGSKMVPYYGDIGPSCQVGSAQRPGHRTDPEWASRWSTTDREAGVQEGGESIATTASGYQRNPHNLVGGNGKLPQVCRPCRRELPT